MDDLPSVVPAGAGEHRHPAARFLDANLNDAGSLLVGERRALSRCSARDEKVHAAVDLPAREATNGGFIKCARRGERRHDRSPDAIKWCSHDDTPKTSRIVNQPRRPCTQRAACKAPSPNAERSLFVWVIVIVSNGPSN